MYTNGRKRRSVKMPVVFSANIFFRILPYAFDMVDADSFPFLHIIPLRLYAWIRRTRLVVTWHEVWSRDFWIGYSKKIGRIGYWVEGLCARISDMNIANASTTKALMEKEFGIRHDKTVVFPAAIDKDEIRAFIAKNRTKKRDQFIVISRLVSHKRVGLAIDAISKTDSKLIVVGEGPDLDALKERASSLAAKGQVVFKKGLGTRELFREIAESKALIMPSEREGLSLVTLEALGLGTPVLVADTSSLPREVRRYCLEAKESKMGDALRKLSKDYASHAKQDRETAAEVLEEFSGDRAGAVYSDIMRRLRGRA
ncbi:Glycosyltransferase Gtf1 [uncultured archaeon]|nr:Glycosyltransferase Gtf1 [uncultured archaeon]